MLAIYYKAWGLPLWVWFVYPVRLHWRKRVFPLWVFSLEIASRLGMGTCVHFSSQCWAPICLRAVWAPCMQPQHLRVYTCTSPIVSRRPVPWCLPSLLVLTYFLPPLPQSSPNPEGTSLRETCHLGLSNLMSLPLYTLSNCRSLCLFLSTPRSFSNDGWTRHWSLSVAECP